MNLWIRSQDRKKLIQVFAIEVDTWKDSNFNKIIISDGNDNDLGSYKTKERALEALDEISDVIAKNEAFVLYSNIGDFTEMNKKKEVFQPVYIMPQE